MTCEPSIEAPSLTDDAFLGGSLQMLQPARGYRAGTDGVLLAAAACVEPGRGRRVLDAGAGVGVVGLAIARRVPEARVTLVEIDPALAELARRNAQRNGLGDRVEVVSADLLRGGGLLHATNCPAELEAAAFSDLVTNPPYHVAGNGTRPAAASRATAHQMSPEGLERWMAFLATAAMADAVMTLIHRAEALAEVLSALEGRFGALQILPVHPHADAAARLILVRARKGSRAAARILPGLVLQHQDGRYRDEVESMLRHGAPLVRWQQ